MYGMKRSGSMKTSDKIALAGVIVAIISLTVVTTQEKNSNDKVNITPILQSTKGNHSPIVNSQESVNISY